MVLDFFKTFFLDTLNKMNKDSCRGSTSSDPIDNLGYLRYSVPKTENRVNIHLVSIWHNFSKDIKKFQKQPKVVKSKLLKVIQTLTPSDGTENIYKQQKKVFSHEILKNPARTKKLKSSFLSVTEDCKRQTCTIFVILTCFNLTIFCIRIQQAAF